MLAWDVAADGSLTSPRTFAETPAGSADGLAVDTEGGVWVATGEAATVVRFTADGSLDRKLDVPGPFVSSLCFGGEDMRDVFITTGDGKLLRGPLRRCRIAAHAGARVASRALSNAATRSGSSSTWRQVKRSTCHPASSRSRSRCLSC